MVEKIVLRVSYKIYDGHLCCEKYIQISTKYLTFMIYKIFNLSKLTRSDERQFTFSKK